MNAKTEKAAKVEAPALRIRATKTGYYNLLRVREGSELVLHSATEFSAAWMEPVGTVPAEFAEEVAFKLDQFDKRKSPEDLRRESVARRASADAKIQADAIAAALSSTLGPVLERALAIQRAEHAQLVREASGQKPASPPTK